jgi:hypothetical protein
MLNTDEFCFSKKVARHQIPFWNQKTSIPTIWLRTRFKMTMIMHMIIKTRNIFLEYFMVIK